jgi:hypothetical protein
VTLFRRRPPLHEQLAREGGLDQGLRPDGREPGLAADAPGWTGSQRGEPGIHGVPRGRRFDAVVTATVPGLVGDSVHFVALADETLVVAEDEPDDSVAALAEAVDASLAAPYRAEAVRRDGTTWAVAARRIRVLELADLEGDEAELVVTPAGPSLTVDGSTSVRRVRALEQVGEETGPEYVVRAERIDDRLWEVEATPL